MPVEQSNKAISIITPHAARGDTSNPDPAIGHLVMRANANTSLPVRVGHATHTSCIGFFCAVWFACHHCQSPILLAESERLFT
jgi:hypothetical protein